MDEVGQQDIIYIWLKEIIDSMGLNAKVKKAGTGQSVRVLRPGGSRYGDSGWIIKVVIEKGPMWGIFLSGGRFDLVVNPANPADLDRGEGRIRAHMEKYL